MQGFMKVVLIIVAFAIGGFALAVMKEVGGGYGAIGVLVALAIGAGIKAIWNYDSDKPEEKKTTEIDKLDKN